MTSSAASPSVDTELCERALEIGSSAPRVPGLVTAYATACILSQQETDLNESARHAEKAARFRRKLEQAVSQGAVYDTVRLDSHMAV